MYEDDQAPELVVQVLKGVNNISIRIEDFSRTNAQPVHTSAGTQ